ncbi:hypothetical protein, partial [Burkholderia dolosa]|uniref:hypothetical protein n=1 Tax=Burkholderia dolosa TaxID=152500 RepID=UPI001C969270
IPNRTVKRLYADDSADSRVKVGNRQAPLAAQTPAQSAGVFAFAPRKNIRALATLAGRRRDGPHQRLRRTSRVQAGGSGRTYRTARFDGPAARHFLMSLDRDHRFPTVLLGVSTANLRQNIVNHGK